MSSQKYLLDSHIHLFRTEDLSNLAWMTPENPLNSQHSIHEYLSTHVHNPTARKPLGFIFLETDRKTNVSATTSPGWDGPLAEFAFVYNAGAGRDPAYKAVADKVLGIVPWGPVPGGSTAMYNYIRRLREIAGTERIDLLKGFRYLVQFCPQGVMLDDAFVDSLRWMGQQSYVFELTVDCRSVGLWQLEEAAEMIKKAHKDVPEEKRVRIIIGKLFSTRSLSQYRVPLISSANTTQRGVCRITCEGRVLATGPGKSSEWPEVLFATKSRNRPLSPTVCKRRKRYIF
jgi:L-rhamnono-1,4-lactonase